MSEEVGLQGDGKTAANRQRAEHRKDVSRAVNDVRERMMSSSGTRPAFDRELTAMFARNHLAAAILLPALTIIIGVIAGIWMEKVIVISWASLTLAANAILLGTCRRFSQQPLHQVELAKWRSKLTIASLLYSIAWIGYFLLSSDTANSFEIFQFATMLVVVAVLTMLSSSLPVTSAAATIPITLATVAIYVAKQEVVYYIMAAMALGAQTFFIALGYRLYKSSLTTLEHRAEKDALIAELEQATAISDDSRRRAEEANLAKSRFLATMSHELRTPLNAILGFSEVIKNEILGPVENETYKEYISDIHSSGQHLLTLINEILDLSRIEAGRQKLVEEAVTLPYIVEDCVHMMSLKARGKDLQIIEQIEPDLPKLWGDERAIRQVILNVLSNAVKFTPAGGKIKAKVGWTAGGGQYVAVRDTGPGIPEDEIPIVLSAFGQGSLAQKSAEPGTGLGLPICQALINLHGGTFDLKSKLREGTEVLITFPPERVLDIMPTVEDRNRPAQRRKAAARG
ncbi:MAG: two-component sensor histidine kinase [Hyphomicrobiales bacterium]|nr:MAG: two-component sensor histidine kinase [Hyphomicrobiales bacterium]